MSLSDFPLTNSNVKTYTKYTHICVFLFEVRQDFFRVSGKSVPNISRPQDLHKLLKNRIVGNLQNFNFNREQWFLLRRGICKSCAALRCGYVCFFWFFWFSRRFYGNSAVFFRSGVSEKSSMSAVLLFVVVFLGFFWFSRRFSGNSAAFFS